MKHFVYNNPVCNLLRKNKKQHRSPQAASVNTYTTVRVLQRTLLSLIGLNLLFSTFGAQANTSKELSPGQLLQRMVVASRSMNYQVIFLRLNNSGFETLRYRHALINHQPFAQLVKLEGTQHEVELRGNTVSYFAAGIEPFSVEGALITDALPALANADFQRLKSYYHFTAAGQGRIADRTCLLIRIIPNDEYRYGYTVWLDKATKLLLRADLLDYNGENLEQFRVVSLDLGGHISNTLKKLTARRLPPYLTVYSHDKRKQSAKIDMHWRAGWLPPGFVEIARQHHQLPPIDLPVEAQLYSDGLFSFALYVHAASRGAKPTPLILQQGQRAVYSEVCGNQEVTVVGEIPLNSAKQIVQKIVFSSGD